MLATNHQAKRCAMCPREFLPRSSFATCCSQRCAMRKVKADKESKAAREKAEFKARKEKLKTVTEWEDECKAIVQKIARIRDRHDGCISCHMGPNYGGKWNGSHFRSVGACSVLQLHLWNIHKACVQCNKDKGGNIAAYRPRLVEKIGADRVDWLERQNGITKRSGPVYIEYLKRFKSVMGKRMRRMERKAKETA